MKHFFKITKVSKDLYHYKHEEPSQKLIKNIQVNWLESLYAKTYKTMPVFINKAQQDVKTTPYGVIHHNTPDYKDNVAYNNDGLLSIKSLLKFDLVVPKQDIMQYFVQWQRYRKYWWSSTFVTKKLAWKVVTLKDIDTLQHLKKSHKTICNSSRLNITTTPSLFKVSDVKNEENASLVEILACFDCGQQSVESITMKPLETDPKKKSCLSCTMGLESAVFVLLLDGVTNNSKDEYLRLHRKMAPYKISFALNFKDSTKKDTLRRLAILLNHKLESKKISTLLPDFSLALKSQIKENLQIGVPYTAVLHEGTLEDGIFGLLNSSTMLEEQVHVADFHSYAAMICQ